MEEPRNIKTLSAVAVVTAALTVPAFAAQHHHVRGHGYGPAHGTRTAHNQLLAPVFYNANPEGIWDHSRVGGVDPDSRPFD
jgi:hypothetical protein